MSEAQTQPVLTARVSKYPNYNQAEAYLKNFLRHGRRSFVRTKRYAYYQHSPSIRVILFRIAPDIYQVRAYPIDAFFFATLEEALKVQDFRAWLFTHDQRNRRTYYIIGSQRVGIERYNQAKRLIRSNPTLAQASQAY
ncbi:unnamed protein product [marine sediment metagenome]|uniref:Uncharacterized protein n=1 Tax=marine sediment metagenome TaxID=412755 RepID=X1SQL6_9ZZZZ